MSLPIRLRAWNLLAPGSKAARNWTIQAHADELAAGALLVAGHYPADYARIGASTPGHGLVDVLIGSRRVGVVNGGYPVSLLDWPREPSQVTLRSFLDSSDLAVLDVPRRTARDRLSSSSGRDDNGYLA